jgi:hypothetical protein
VPASDRARAVGAGQDDGDGARSGRGPAGAPGHAKRARRAALSSRVHRQDRTACVTTDCGHDAS